MLRPLILTFLIFASGLYFACQTQDKVTQKTSVNSQADSELETHHKIDLSILEKNCFKCHGPDKQKGKVRLDQLDQGMMTREKMALIKESLRLIKDGDMPPKKEKTLSPSEKQEIETLFAAILNKNIDASRQENQTVYRRLNNQEYLNTTAELFGFDPKVYDPTINFPADQRHEGFNTLGSALISTKFLTKEYLEAAHEIVDKMLRFENPAEVTSYNFKHKDFITNAKDSESAILYGSFHSGDNYQGSEVYLKNFIAPEDGFYSFRIQAEAKNRQHNLPPKIVYNDQQEPLRLGLKTGHHSNANMHFVFDLADNESWYECRIWLHKGQSPQLVYPNAIYSAHNYRFTLPKIPNIHTLLGISKEDVTGKISSGYNAGRGHIYKNIFDVVKKLPVPKIHIREVNIEGPFYESWSPLKNNNVIGKNTLRLNNWPQLLRQFADRAFRRPCTNKEITPYTNLVHSQLSQGVHLTEAFKTAVKAILCSPRFLFIQEKNQQLDQYEIANRLSYFLWSSMPDKTLFKAAEQNKLSNTQEMLKQVERMLNDPKAENFATNFTSSWLRLYDLGGILPHNKIFKDYYQMNIQESIKKETILYFQYVLQNNRTIIDFLDSDYTILDRRLAKLYKLPLPEMKDVISDNSYNGHAPSTGFVKYTFENQRRGGLMGHASVLTVSANGVDTSPVIRGVWILENLLCSPPPPAPSDVASIEPDTRGSKSIKERLKKHQDDPNCASCHKKIDPIGFALENYNPIGQWRTRYKYRQKVDASGAFHGQEFKDITGLKKALLDGHDDFANAFTEKLLSYAIGRETSFLDEQELHQIQEKLKSKRYGLQELVKLICTSPLFFQK